MRNVLDLRQQPEPKEFWSARKLAVLFLVSFAIGIAYQYYLSSGCELDGAMTWHGKVCIQ